jgi:hypothetical protein
VVGAQGPLGVGQGLLYSGWHNHLGGILASARPLTQTRWIGSAFGSEQAVDERVREDYRP